MLAVLVEFKVFLSLEEKCMLHEPEQYWCYSKLLRYTISFGIWTLVNKVRARGPFCGEASRISKFHK